MSLSTTIATGTLLGGLLAVGVYAATAPSDQVAATVKVAPTFGPVPTPTVTHLAPCAAPAKLEHGVCVTHVPGPTFTVPASVRSSSSTSDRTAEPTHGPTSRPAATTPTTRPTTGDDDGDDHGGEDDHDGDDDHGGYGDD
ncbi:MAG: hypothetical protein IE926_16390 [Micrococcales bacterium]|uniref:hypothetical protein n=1 Tax=Phycicoccus sp. TaxID=1902410 RepID=UPI0019AA5D2A|nr:hypothetical protein [Phycicoccus sp.]MBD3784500.1 hypothetical protein [Micrococcales bacterium]HMM97145.1 hypothetical protein [Phycicoccus sp.]